MTILGLDDQGHSEKNFEFINIFNSQISDSWKIPYPKKGKLKGSTVSLKTTSEKTKV